MTMSSFRCVTPNDDQLVHFQHLVSDCGWVDLSQRDQIELGGRDRQRFLHNLCTNDILRLAPGQGCEAFATTVRGKCIGFIHAFVGPEFLVVETAPDQSQVLLSHWDRYLVSEDVQLVDRTQDWSEILLAGPRVPELFHSTISGPGPDADFDHCAATVADVPVWVRRVTMTGPPSFLIACATDHLEQLKAHLRQAGVAQCSLAAFHLARVEQGFPWYGWDVSEQNLPQEVGRDSSAIKFDKGCYLGQETVARIDALGHVNRKLVGLRVEQSAVPQANSEIVHESQVVGQVTSAAFSPALGLPLAMGYVRRESSAPGTKLQIDQSDAEIVSLPVSKNH